MPVCTMHLKAGVEIGGGELGEGSGCQRARSAKSGAPVSDAGKRSALCILAAAACLLCCAINAQPQQVAKPVRHAEVHRGSSAAAWNDTVSVQSLQPAFPFLVLLFSRRRLCQADQPRILLLAADLIHAHAEAEGGSSAWAAAARVIRQVAGLKAARPFLSPVREEDAPGYHAAIKHPMDLGTVQQQLSARAYKAPGAPLAETMFAGAFCSCDPMRMLSPPCTLLTSTNSKSGR